MRRRVISCLLAAMCLMALMPAGGMALDNGMEGLWVGADSGGTITLMLGSGGTFISMYESDQTYRRAGVYWVDQDVMYLSDSNGNDTELQYGFSEGSLFLASGGDEVEMLRQAMPDLSGMTGLWTAESGGGLIGFDAAGNIVSVDVATGEAEKGIFFLNQGDILIAFQDGSAMQMGCEVSEEGITLTDPDTGDALTLIRYPNMSTE